MYAAWERMESHAPTEKRPKAKCQVPFFFPHLKNNTKESNVSLLLVYFQSTKLILFCSNMAEGMIPSLQSPMHGYRLRHLSARVALQPCAYSTGDCFITTFQQTSSSFMDDTFSNTTERSNTDIAVLLASV